MAILRILELAVAAITLLLAITQVVIPLLRGTLLFPLFRKEHRLEVQLSQARQEELEAGLQKELKQRQDQIEKLKQE